MLTIPSMMALPMTIPFDVPLAAMALGAFAVALTGLLLSLPHAPRGVAVARGVRAGVSTETITAVAA